MQTNLPGSIFENLGMLRIASIVPLVAKIGMEECFAITGRPVMWSTCSCVIKMPSISFISRPIP
jgi:hypothetical protein